MSDKKYREADCIYLLKNKYEELKKNGIDPYPQRSDFEELEVVAIKAFFGPWPCALEAAGIKPPRDDDHAQKKGKTDSCKALPHCFDQKREA